MDDTLARQFAVLQSGDHLCLVYEDVDEAFRVTAQFIALGIARGLRCFCTTGDYPIDRIVSVLAEAGVDVSRERARGALELHHSGIHRDARDPDGMVQSLGQRTADALAAGFAGLAYVAEMSWIHANGVDPDQIMAYESRLSTLFATQPIIAICLYNRHRFPPPVLRDAVRTHPLVVVADLVCPNFYYEPPDIFRGRRSVARQVAWMTDQIRRARQAEQEHERLIREQAEREEAERALRRVRTLLESISDGFYAFDRDWRFSFVNDRGAALLGKTTGDLIGRNVWEIFPALVHSPFDVAAHQALADQTRVDLEQRWITSNKRLAFRLYPSSDGLTVYAQDVTQRRNDEEALARVAERERIAMDLHDGVIQALYAVALGLASLEKRPAEDLAEIRAGIARARHQLSEVIGNVRRFIEALPERGRASEDLRTRLVELIDEFGLAPRARLVPRVAPPSLAATEANLGPAAIDDVVNVARQALANVARHADARVVTVRLAVSRNQFVLTVRDNGRGFDLGATRESNGDGLHNMAERIRRLGGRLEVTSRPGAGTRVRLVVPLPAPADHAR